jgi:hypothetical protein
MCSIVGVITVSFFYFKKKFYELYGQLFAVPNAFVFAGLTFILTKCGSSCLSELRNSTGS